MASEIPESSIFLLMPVQKVVQVRAGKKLVYLGLDQIYS